MQKRSKDLLVGSLAVLAAAGALYFAFGPRSEKVDLDTYAVLGTVAGEETARLLGSRGSVLVMVRDTGEDKNPSVEAELSAFERAVKKHSGLSLAVQRVQVTPTLMMSTGGGLPADQLFQALEGHAHLDALVLFFGFPPLSDAEVERLSKYGTKTVVISSFHPDYRHLLAAGAIHLVVAPRPETTSPEARPPRTVRERFDQEYVVITAGEMK